MPQRLADERPLALAARRGASPAAAPSLRAAASAPSIPD
jgi:hypothetical protein